MLDLSVHVSVFILNNAKLRMLQFYYDLIDKYLNRPLYEINKTNTDSLYMSLTGNSVEEMVPQEQKEALKAEKYPWFVTPQAQKSKKSPALFKIEYTSTKMVSLCCIKDTENKLSRIFLTYLVWN